MAWRKVVMMKIVNSRGKRKTAVARAVLKKGTGNISINGQSLEKYTPELLKFKIREPLMLSGSVWKKIDMSITVKGGGTSGQADAVRMAIARGLIDWSGDEALEKKIKSYDVNLVSYDPRRTETRKPSRSSKGARKKKQMSKR